MLIAYWHGQVTRHNLLFGGEHLNRLLSRPEMTHYISCHQSMARFPNKLHVRISYLKEHNTMLYCFPVWCSFMYSVWITRMWMNIKRMMQKSPPDSSQVCLIITRYFTAKSRITLGRSSGKSQISFTLNVIFCFTFQCLSWPGRNHSHTLLYINNILSLAHSFSQAEPYSLPPFLEDNCWNKNWRQYRLEKRERAKYQSTLVLVDTSNTFQT